MNEHVFKPGEMTFVGEDTPVGRFSAFFEEDEEIAYFYAVDDSLSENPIVDAVHIYYIANLVDRDRSSTLSIVWSDDGLKCALLINNYAHAPFDFEAQRGYCRTNNPDFEQQTPGHFTSTDHSWSDDAISWLGKVD